MHEAGLLGLLRDMAPEGAGLGWADPHRNYPLMPGEAVPGAVPARLREFAAGRDAARMALAGIGVAGVAIPHGGDRAPVWPPGVVGSITHTATACLAIALPSRLCRGIGLDLEEDSPLPPDLWDVVLRPDEQDGATGDSAKAVFCAKEAAYKAQYPISRTVYGFDQMQVNQSGDRFRAVFRGPVPPFQRGDSIEGQLSRGHGHILALARL